MASCAPHESRFHRPPEVAAVAPGRVNLIGEHVDYNDGLVLPFAIKPSVRITASRREDRRVIAVSGLNAEPASFPVGVTAPAEPGAWENYLRGVLVGLRELGVGCRGANLHISGDLPAGGGLSSSAALCVAAAQALALLTGASVPTHELPRLAQVAERDFGGTPCGLMDPYVCVQGRAGHALLLDCRTQTHAYVAVNLPDCAFLLLPSGVPHALAGSAYEDRVNECQAAVTHLARQLPDVRALRDVTPAQLDAHAAKLPPLVARRAEHVCREIERVQAAVAALRRGDAATLGALLDASQDSLRDLYEVSCAEVDALIAAVRAAGGVHGARMIGGGFGGMVLALVERSAVAAVIQAVREGYYRPNGIVATPQVVAPQDGARAWRITTRSAPESLEGTSS